MCWVHTSTAKLLMSSADPSTKLKVGTVNTLLDDTITAVVSFETTTKLLVLEATVGKNNNTKAKITTNESCSQSPLRTETFTITRFHKLQRHTSKQSYISCVYISETIPSSVSLTSPLALQLSYILIPHTTCFSCINAQMSIYA